MLLRRGIGPGVSRQLLIKRTALFAAPLLFLIAFLAAGCSSGSDTTLFIGGIPDQETVLLEKRFNAFADYLEEELGISVVYSPSISYAALVTAFENGDIQLGWFGALTGIQARNAAPGSHAIAQRFIDAEFQSVFIVNDKFSGTSLADLAGHSFTFGSESSTSGHLMPRYFLNQAGINPEADFNLRPNYSGSHDQTLQLIQQGSYTAGALNAAVWDRSVRENNAEGNTSNNGARVLLRTEPYFDYHWLAHTDIDSDFGQGTTDKILKAILELNNRTDKSHILELFQASPRGFIETQNSNYDRIEEIAAELGLLGE